MPSINDRIGTKNVIRVLSNAAAPPLKLNGLTDINSDNKENKDGNILVWDTVTEKYYLSNTIDSTTFVSTGFVTFTNTQQSTSSSTGAFVVDGGAGIEKNLYVGESLNIGENVFVTGLSTFSNDVLINNELSVTGLTTVTNTTDNVLGNPDTGALQIDGGVGINKNLTVGGSFYVQGTSEFIGNATFRGGTIGIGDADTDDINVAGEFVSNLVPNDNNTYDLGIDGKRWRTGRFSTLLDTNNLLVTGISTFSSDLDINASVDINNNLLVTGVSTFTSLVDANNGIDASSAKIEDLTENRVVISGIGGELEDDANFTFDGSQLVVGAALTVTGVSTFASLVDINASAEILNNLNVSGFATVNQGLYYTSGNFDGPNGIAYFDNTGKLIGAASTELGISTTNYVLTTNASGLPVWTTTIDGGEY